MCSLMKTEEERRYSAAEAKNIFSKPGNKIAVRLRAALPENQGSPLIHTDNTDRKQNACHRST